MLVMIKAWAKYVFISLAPIVLTHNHVISQGIFSFPPMDFDKFAVLSQSVFDTQVLLSLGVLGGIFYAAVRAWKRRPLVTFCIGWFFISLLPASNIIPTSIYFGEWYLYHGLWGFCLLLGIFCQGLLEGKEGSVGQIFFPKRRISPWLMRRVGIGLICLLTAFYGARTWVRNKDGRNEIVLFEAAIKANPYSVFLRHNLSIVYVSYRMFDKARALMKETREIQAANPGLLQSEPALLRNWMENYSDGYLPPFWDDQCLLLEELVGGGRKRTGNSYYSPPRKEQKKARLPPRNYSE
jgi:hypothetical protein